MATSLGKRKRKPAREPNPSPLHPEEDEAALKALFQKHFEARFKPLPVSKSIDPVGRCSDPDSDSDAESNWSGISTSSTPSITIITHTTTTTTIPQPLADPSSKQELNAFLSGKPPPSSTTLYPKKALSKPTAPAADDEDSTQNLKNDLALQRLLTESHLLSKSPNTFTSSTLDPSGKTRHKALDMRLQNLGSKSSVYKQQKMPMSHRQGMLKKGAEREGKRRKEAKENGIVLERAVKKEKVRGKRDAGVGGPGVGKFKSGMLTLSRRDIDSIQGPPARKKGRR